MLKSQVRESDEDAGIALSGIIVVILVALAMVGVLAGLWKIDMFGLVAICAGAFIMMLFFPNPWAFLPGLALIALGLLLWFDVIGVSLSIAPSPIGEIIKGGLS